MKRVLIILAVSLLTAFSAIAQSDNYPNYYFGVDGGLSMASIHSASDLYDSNEYQQGAYIGVNGGIRIVQSVPLFFEAGVYYTEKGGRTLKERLSASYTVTTKHNLNYLELPLLLRYKINARVISIEPFAGGYVAAGIGGKVRGHHNEDSFYAFDSDNPLSFKRFDSGVKLGCSVNYRFIHLRLAYEAGLVNIAREGYGRTTNGCFQLGLGFSF